MSDTTLIQDGIHLDLDEKVYRADPACSISDLKEMDYSPAHYYSKKFGGYRPTKSDAQALGTLVHMAVLEPERFASSITLAPDDAPNRPSERQRNAKKPSEETIKAIEYWDEWDKNNSGKEIINRMEMAQVKAMAESIMGNEHAEALLEGSQREVAMFATREIDGRQVRIKGKADIICAHCIADIKTVDRGYANHRDFSFAIAKWRYHQQSAFYLDLYNQITHDPFGDKEPLSRWFFIVIEKEPPYDCVVLEMDQMSIEIGRKEYTQNLARLAICMERNEWPGRSQAGIVGLPDHIKRNH